VLKRWHGRMGVIASLFVLILAATGLALNHVSNWGFDRQAVRSPHLLGIYGMAEVAAVTSYPLAQGHVSESNQRLFYQRQEILSCEGALVGVVALSTESDSPLVVACERQLLLFSADFELIEQIDSTVGLPTGVKRLGLLDGRLLIDSTGGLLFADLDALSWTLAAPTTDTSPIQWSTAVPTPDDLRQALSQTQGGEDITYERLLLDIHSGRILGEWGVYLVDAMALLFMLLAITGLVIWRQGKGPKDKKR